MHRKGGCQTRPERLEQCEGGVTTGGGRRQSRDQNDDTAPIMQPAQSQSDKERNERQKDSEVRYKMEKRREQLTI